jgi:KUP system potassium uptake protein
MQIVEPPLSAWVVPVTVAVLTALFAIQRHGTAVVGRMFGPVMLFRFLTLAVLGAAEVARHRGILRALSPYYAWQFFRTDGWVAFLATAATVIASQAVITGAFSVTYQAMRLG